MSESEMPEVVARLELLDRKVERLLELIASQSPIKDFYTTAEVAAIIGKAEFTVREYCRLRRIKGQKRACGRGKHPAWIVAHEEPSIPLIMASSPSRTVVHRLIRLARG